MTSPQPPGRLFKAMQEFTLESDRYIERVASLHGLHRTDLNALAYLMRPSIQADAKTPGKLGDALNLSSPATTALVDRLERSGHVTRQRSQSDRRQVDLAMTEHARTVGRQLFRPLTDRLGQALEKYSVDELALVERFLLDMAVTTAEAKENLQAPLPTTAPQ